MAIERLDQAGPVNKIQSEYLARDQKSLAEQIKKSVRCLPASQVQLSSFAQYFDIDSSKDIDIKQVQDFQRTISDGSFIIDTDNIARKLLVTLFELS